MVRTLIGWALNNPLVVVLMALVYVEGWTWPLKAAA